MSGDFQTVRPWLTSSEYACNPGLSIYWIIQNVFIKSLINYLSELGYNLPENIKASFGGYEPPGKTLTFEKKETGVLLNGEKGFITGAFDSDWIFLSARKIGEEKISSLIAVKNDGIIKDSLTDLKLQAFHNISHASLKLNEALVENAILDSSNPPELRRIIKSGNIMERIMILEMSVFLAKYILNLLDCSELSVKLNSLIEKLKESTDSSFESFKKGEKIYENPDLKKETYSLFSDIESLLLNSSISKKFPEYLSEISFLKKFLLT
jgi:hypothetical protein